ncbi:MAG: ABC transporter permease [Methanomassiliicoccales archaeon]|nr:ABC transporter permease [Methanomassiliicoccales archaeon]
MTEGEVRIINPRKTRSLIRTFSEIWSYRELLYFFVWKEIKIRYKQTVIGAAWAILQPLIAMAIFWFIFGIVLDIQTGVPYPIFAYSGLLIWTYFSTSLNQASGSVVSNSHILTKVYFPRILLPLAFCLTGLLDYAIAAVMLLALMLWFNIMPTLWIFLIVIPLILSILLASGLSFWLSAVSAKYRDVRYLVPFFVQLMLFVTPIIYPPSYLTGSLAWVVTLNPLAAIVTAQRSFVLGTGIVDWAPLGISTLIALLIFFAGLLYFSRYERELADVI